MVDDIGIQVVEAYLDSFDIADVSSCVTLIKVNMKVAAEFGQQMAEDCGDVGRNIQVG